MWKVIFPALLLPAVAFAQQGPMANKGQYLAHELHYRMIWHELCGFDDPQQAAEPSAQAKKEMREGDKEFWAHLNKDVGHDIMAAQEKMYNGECANLKAQEQREGLPSNASAEQVSKKIEQELMQHGQDLKK